VRKFRELVPPNFERNDREQVRLHGHGFVPDAAERNSENLCRLVLFREISFCSVSLWHWAAVHKIAPHRPGVRVPVALLFASRSTASTAGSMGCLSFIIIEAKPPAAEGGVSKSCHWLRPPRNSENLCPRCFFVKFLGDSLAGTATSHDGSFAAFQGLGISKRLRGLPRR
jgi:hypothetical protein